MSRRRKDPLRALTDDERGSLEQLGRATSAPAGVAARARALVAVADGCSYTEAARRVGRRSGDAVGELVARFNREGLAAVEPRHGGGPRVKYGAAERERILAEVRRAGPGAGPDGDLVADDAPAGAAGRRGWAPGGQHVHDLVRAARGRPELAARPVVVPHRAGEAAAQSRRGRGPRSGRDGKKGLIERAYTQVELPVWTEDEAGPYQAIPQPGAHWRPTTSPARYPHEHIRHGTAKLLTLFHPASGQVRVKGVTSAANEVLHPWLEAELASILATLPEPPAQTEAERRAAWERWQEGLTVPFTLPDHPPPLRMLLVLDNLTGHKTPRLVLWLVTHGVMPLYTPLSGSWLNMAESIQRILVRRALAGETPTSPDNIIAWLEATARGWNADPTPFEWAGKRLRRRQRSRQRHHHALGGSGAWTRRPVRRRPTTLDQWRRSCQVTH